MTKFFCNRCKTELDDADVWVSLEIKGDVAEEEQSDEDIDLCDKCHGELKIWLQKVAS